MRDQKGKGIEHMIVKAWPLQINSAQRLNKIL